MQCPNCGTYNATGSQFCNGCGRPLQPVKEPTYAAARAHRKPGVPVRLIVLLVAGGTILAAIVLIAISLAARSGHTATGTLAGQWISFRDDPSLWQYHPNSAPNSDMSEELWQSTDGIYVVSVDRSVAVANDSDLEGFVTRYRGDDALAVNVRRSNTTYLGDPAVTVRADYGTTQRALRWSNYYFQQGHHWYVVSASCLIGYWNTGGSDEVTSILNSVTIK